ncbi:MAG: hypothetical protein CWE10_17545 [Symbiobacterium thermophilum]|uniref:Uncharacterized protein n=2 Tax=Symbiobacterium thermophilum TaxID=2734 RepID=A0A953IG76_SYMTR|nr:hypothetical protein [Symbiobacterium thermophilum]
MARSYLEEAEQDMAREKITQEDREKFAEFLFEMDDVLEEFIEEASQAGYDLDYSLESLDRLEEYWLAVSPRVEDPVRLMNRMARYYGEVFRLNFGGKWRLSDRNPRHMYYGYPVIYGFIEKNPEFEFCPLFQFQVFAAKQTRGLLRSVLDVVYPPSLRPHNPPQN